MKVTHDDKHRRTLRSRVAALAVTGVLLALPAAAIAHSDNNGLQPLGPNGCSVEWNTEHNSTYYSAGTAETFGSAARDDCRGVETKFSYKLDGIWWIDTQRDTWAPYATAVNGAHDIANYSDHNAKDTASGIWYGLRRWH